MAALHLVLIAAAMLFTPVALIARPPVLQLLMMAMLVLVVLVQLIEPDKLCVRLVLGVI